MIPDAQRRDHAIGLVPGDTVVLYTDGLVERRDADLDRGLARLLVAAGDLAARPVDQLCDALLAAVRPDLADDIAVVVLRVPDRPASSAGGELPG